MTIVLTSMFWDPPTLSTSKAYYLRNLKKPVLHEKWHKFEKISQKLLRSEHMQKSALNLLEYPLTQISSLI